MSPTADVPMLHPRFQLTLAGQTFNSFIFNASGTFNPGVFNQIFPLSQVMGGIVTKTVTMDGTHGNPQARTAELPGVGMLNSIGLQNPGLAYTLEQVVPEYAAYGLPVILSISANTVEDFAKMAEAIAGHSNQSAIAALELNLSCPNIKEGGIHFGVNPAMVREVTQVVSQTFPRPVFAKLTPNVHNLVAIGEAAVEGGAFGLTAINTLLGAAIDIKRRKPVLARVSGGYSGPGVKPVAIHAIYQLRKALPETVIFGVGGISNADDVLEFLMAGANMVQVGTICYRDPLVYKTLIRDLQAFAVRENIGSFQDIVSCAHH